ncbi:aluminum-activated malate transporter 2-like [Silene latifolia]|uniref:aluminum-activated malate transporter 2-like n=1 Tax=Silene latifolia TaxID=37657 RepID=UPI003D76BB5C
MENRDENSNNFFKAKLAKIKNNLVLIGQLTKQLVKDDPRRIVHSFKVGLAIALVSLFYYFDPLYEGFGVNAMWGVLTVVVVFEYSVGATVGKSLNRVVSTIIGGWLAVGDHRLCSYWGDDLEPVLLGFSVFLTAAVATFMRFYPIIKARYDYGMQIFILTFSLICVSGYRDDEVIDMAQRRISTILIGCCTAVVICVVIRPVWAGHDLHNVTASNLAKLGNFLQEFGVEYFKKSTDVPLLNDGKSFQSIIDSKSSVDTLSNFARWEPWHGRFKYTHPWIQYQIICGLTRVHACRAEALHNILYCRTQAPNEVKAKFLEPCSKMSIESGKALKELSFAIKEMTEPSKANAHIQNAKKSAQDLNELLKSNLWENINLLDVTRVATVASLLNEVVTCTEEIAEAVQRLATLAKFTSIVDDNKVAVQDGNSKMLNQLSSMKSRSSTSYVIIVDGSTPRSSNCEDPPSLAMAQQDAE